MAELPRWVWDLLADLIDEEDVHPKLYAEMFVTASGKHEMVPYDWCPTAALARVPADIRGGARIIAGYRRGPSINAELIHPDSGGPDV
jgi:hypothetical protein